MVIMTTLLEFIDFYTIRMFLDREKIAIIGNYITTN